MCVAVFTQSAYLSSYMTSIYHGGRTTSQFKMNRTTSSSTSSSNDVIDDKIFIGTFMGWLDQHIQHLQTDNSLSHNQSIDTHKLIKNIDNIDNIGLALINHISSTATTIATTIATSSSITMTAAASTHVDASNCSLADMHAYRAASQAVQQALYVLNTLNYVVIAIGILFNIINLLVLFGSNKLNESPYTYLSVLAVSDLCSLLTFVAEKLRQLLPQTDTVRQMHLYAITVAINIFQSCSMYTTLALTIERFIFVHSPFKAATVCRRSIARRACLLIVVFSVARSLYLPFMYTPNCSNGYSQRKLNIIDIYEFLISLAIPYLVIFVVNISLIFSLRKQNYAHRHKAAAVLADASCSPHRLASVSTTLVGAASASAGRWSLASFRLSLRKAATCASDVDTEKADSTSRDEADFTTQPPSPATPLQLHLHPTLKSPHQQQVNTTNNNNHVRLVVEDERSEDTSGRRGSSSACSSSRLLRSGTGASRTTEEASSKQQQQQQQQHGRLQISSPHCTALAKRRRDRSRSSSNKSNTASQQSSGSGSGNARDANRSGGGGGKELMFHRTYSRRESKNQKKLTVTLVIILCLLLVCYLPSFLFEESLAEAIFGSHDLPGRADSLRAFKIKLVGTRLSIVFIYVNCSCNFLIYCFCNKKFKQAFVQLLMRHSTPLYKCYAALTTCSCCCRCCSCCRYRSGGNGGGGRRRCTTNYLPKSVPLPVPTTTPLSSPLTPTRIIANEKEKRKTHIIAFHH